MCLVFEILLSMQTNLWRLLFKTLTVVSKGGYPTKTTLRYFNILSIPKLWPHPQTCRIRSLAMWFRKLRFYKSLRVNQPSGWLAVHCFMALKLPRPYAKLPFSSSWSWGWCPYAAIWGVREAAGEVEREVTSSGKNCACIGFCHLLIVWPEAKHFPSLGPRRPS